VTETELVFQYSEILDRIWNVTQFWSSVSFGLIVLAYLAAHRLNRLLLISVTTVYTVYTYWIGTVLARNTGWQSSIGRDLENLASNGEVLSIYATDIVELTITPPFSLAILSPLMLLGVYIVSIGYLFYAYRHRNAAKS